MKLGRSAGRAFAVAVLLVASAALGQPVFQQQVIHQRPPSVTTEPTGRVAELIGRLSAESAGPRRAAARALLDMGPAIEPQLQWARQHGELGGQAQSWPLYQVPGTREWREDLRYLQRWHAANELDVLISHLDEQRRTGTSLITLHYQDAPLTNVLREFGRQADADVAVGSWYASPDWARTNRATVNVDRVNYWEALAAIQHSAGLAPFHGNGQNRLVLMHVADAQAPTNAAGAVVCGPLRIVPIAAEREREAVRLTLQAFAEPKLSETEPHALVRLDRCVDELGKSLIADGQRTFASVERNDTWRWTVPLKLKPLAAGRRIKTLKGQFSVGLGPTDRYMTITNVLHARGQSRELDGLRVAVKRVDVTGSQHRVEVELSAPEGSPYTRTFTANCELEVWLWDEAPRTIISEKVFNGVRHEAGRTVGSWSLLTPKDSPPPATLVWKTPTETRWHTVPFELHDLAVPAVAGK